MSFTTSEHYHAVSVRLKGEFFGSIQGKTFRVATLLEDDGAMAMVERFSNPIIGLALGAVVGALFGAISGAIGAVIFKKGGDADELATEM